MPSKCFWYTFLSMFALLATGGLAYTFFKDLFVFAWLCAVVTAVCMEGRIAVAGRIPHTWIFWIHLCAAVFFFSILSVLAFIVHPLWLIGIAYALLFPAFLGGAILWYQGLHILFRSTQSQSL